MPQKPRPRGKGDAQIPSTDLNVVVAAEVVVVVEVASVEIVEIGMVTVKIVANVVVAVAEENVADVDEVEDVVDSVVKTEEASVVKTGEDSVVDLAVDLVVMQASQKILDLVVDLVADLEVVVMTSQLEDEAGDVELEDLHVSDQTTTMHHPHLRILVDLENLTQAVSVVVLVADSVEALVVLMVKREIGLLDEGDSVAAAEEEEEEDVGAHVNLTGEVVMTKAKNNKDLEHLQKKLKKLLSKLKQKLF